MQNNEGGIYTNMLSKFLYANQKGRKGLKTKPVDRARICEIIIPLFDFQKSQELDCKAVEAKTLKIINQKKNVIKNYCYVIHDKDIDENGNSVPKHIHMAIEWTNGKDRKAVAGWFKTVNALVARHRRLANCQTNFYYIDLCFQLIYDKNLNLIYPYEMIKASFDAKSQIKEYGSRYFKLR